MILQGPSAIATQLGLDRLQSDLPLLALDELHKYQHWRDFLKGFFDQYEDLVRVLVTGSASLETFKRGGDSLNFIRDKQKREVDFVVTRDQQPWFLVEVKSSGKAGLSDALVYFQQQTSAKYAFQVALDLPFVERDCFAHASPIIVPARTFLSQLV